MIMNIAANMLGLSNAATPLGLKAMEELDKLNPKKGEATDDMCMFLVINTTAITLIPATAIAIRASVGSANPQMIIIPSILAASCATIVGITIVKTIQAINRRKNKNGSAVAS
jgi:spore maturation protein A